MPRFISQAEFDNPTDAPTPNGVRFITPQEHAAKFSRPPAQPTPEQPLGWTAPITEAAKGLAKGTAQVVQSIGGAVPEMLGAAGAEAVDAIRSPQPFPGMTQEQWREIQASRQAITPTPNPLAGQAEAAQDFYGGAVNYPAIQPDPRIANTEYLGKDPFFTKLTKLGSDVGGVVPSLGAAIGGALVAGPVGAGVAGGSLEASSWFEEARKSGVSEKEALAGAAIIGSGTGILNALPFLPALQKVVPPKLQGKLANFFVRGLAEGSTETSEGGLTPFAELASGQRNVTTPEEALGFLEDIAGGVYDESGVFLPAALSGGLIPGGSATRRSKPQTPLQQEARQLLLEYRGAAPQLESRVPAPAQQLGFRGEFNPDGSPIVPGDPRNVVPLTEQPLPDPRQQPMTRADLDGFMDDLARFITSRKQGVEALGEQAPQGLLPGDVRSGVVNSPNRFTPPSPPQGPTSSMPDISEAQQRRLAREGNPAIAPVPPVFEPRGGGGGYVGPAPIPRPEPREFEQPFMPGDINRPDFRTLVPPGSSPPVQPPTPTEPPAPSTQQTAKEKLKARKAKLDAERKKPLIDTKAAVEEAVPVEDIANKRPWDMTKEEYVSLTEDEKPSAVATKFSSGRIGTGEIHALIKPRPGEEVVEEGFLTNKNRFVSRSEAGMLTGGSYWESIERGEQEGSSEGIFSPIEDDDVFDGPQPKQAARYYDYVSQQRQSTPAQPEPPQSKPDAEFKGWQERPRGQSPIALYNIPTPDGGKTTVTAETARAQGFNVPEPPAAPTEPASPAKQPWEMTRDDWEQARSEASKTENRALKMFAGSPAQKELSWATPERIRLEYGADPSPIRKGGVPIVTHESVIRKALASGLPVPPEVLADYPDLAKGAATSPTPPPPKPGPKERKLAKDRVDKHGLTKDQMAYLTGEIQARWSELPNKKSDYEGVPNVATIKVPGDGTFIIGTQEAANAIHKRLTGKWIDESMAYDSKKTGGASPVDPRTSPDYIDEKYTASAKTIKEQREGEDEALRLLNEAKTPTEVAYARMKYDRAMRRNRPEDTPQQEPAPEETTSTSEETAKGNKFFWYGDEAQYTGKTTESNGTVFYEFEYLEGAKKGKKGVRMAPDDPKASKGESNKPTGRPTPQVPPPTPASLRQATTPAKAPVAPTEATAAPESLTPNERFMALNDRYKAGEITREQFDKQRADIMKEKARAKKPTKAKAAPIAEKMSKQKSHSAYMAHMAVGELENIAGRTDRARNSDKAKREADKAWVSLSTHAGRLGIEIPKRGTFFNIDSDVKLASQIKEQLPAWEQVYDAKKGKRGADPTNPEAGVINIGSIKNMGRTLMGDKLFLEFHRDLRDAKDLNVRRMGEAAAIVREAEQAVADLNKAWRDTEGGITTKFKKMPEPVRKQVNDYMKEGDPAQKARLLSALPQPMQAPAMRLRELTDATSRRLLSEGVATGATAEIIEDNEGTYLRRTYKIFKDKDFKNTIPDAVKERARKWLQREHPDVVRQPNGEQEIQKMLNALVNIADSTEPVVIRRGKKLGTKDLSTLMKRNDFPQEILDLWGVEQDGVVNFLESMTSMAHMIANHKFYREVAKAGEGQYVFSKQYMDNYRKGGNPAYERMLANNELVPWDEGSTKKENVRPATETGAYGAMQGAYVHRDFKQAMQDAVKIDEVVPWLANLNTFNSWLKMGKTVFSPTTQSLNMLSNTYIALANGHILYGNPVQAIDRMRQAIGMASTELTSRHNPKWRAQGNRAIQLRVMGDTDTASELMALRGESKRNTINKGTRDFASKIDPVFEKAIDGLGYMRDIAIKLYQGGDDVWKAFAWLTETQHLVDSGMSKTKAEEEAAFRVRRMYPTYTETPNLVQKARRFPAAGPFVSFVAEIPRNSVNTLLQTQLDLRSDNPKVRAMGLRRTAGIIGAIGSAYGAEILGRMMLDMDDDDDDAVRKGLPPWEHNSLIGWSQFDREKGTATGQSISRMNPYAVVFDPITAFLRAEGPGSGIVAATEEIADPYIQEEIGFKAIRQQIQNLDDYNNPIVLESDPLLEKFWKRAMAALKVGEPGAVPSVRRIMEDDNPLKRAMQEATGQRIVKVDMPKSLRFRAMEFQRQSSEPLRDVRSAIREGDPEAVREQWDQYLAAHKRGFDELHDMVAGMEYIGISKRDIAKTLDEAGVSEENRLRIIKGKYKAPPMRPDVRKALR